MQSISIYDPTLAKNALELNISINNIIDSANVTRIKLNFPEQSLLYNTKNEQSATLNFTGKEFSGLSEISLGSNKKNTLKFNKDAVLDSVIISPNNIYNGIVEINANVTFRAKVGKINSGPEKIVISAKHELTLEGDSYNAKEYILKESGVLNIDSKGNTEIRGGINNINGDDTTGVIRAGGNQEIKFYGQIGNAGHRLKEIAILQGNLQNVIFKENVYAKELKIANNKVTLEKSLNLNYLQDSGGIVFTDQGTLLLVNNADIIGGNITSNQADKGNLEFQGGRDINFIIASFDKPLHTLSIDSNTKVMFNKDVFVKAITLINKPQLVINEDIAFGAENIANIFDKILLSRSDIGTFWLYKDQILDNTHFGIKNNTFKTYDGNIPKALGIANDKTIEIADSINIPAIYTGTNNTGTVLFRGTSVYTQLGENNKRFKEVKIYGKTNINKPVYTQKLVIKNNLIEINDVLKTDIIHLENNLAGIDIKKGFVDPVIITTSGHGRMSYRDNGSIGTVGDLNQRFDEVKFDKYNILMMGDVYSKKIYFYEGKYDLSHKNISVYGDTVIKNSTFDLKSNQVAFYGNISMEGSITINMSYNNFNGERVILNNGKLDSSNLTSINLKMKGTADKGTSINILKLNNYQLNTIKFSLYDSPGWNLSDNGTLLFDNSNLSNTTIYNNQELTSYKESLTQQEPYYSNDISTTPNTLSTSDTDEKKTSIFEVTNEQLSELQNSNYSEQYIAHRTKTIEIIYNTETGVSTTELYSKIQQIADTLKDTKEKKEFLFRAFKDIESNSDNLTEISTAQLKRRSYNAHAATHHATKAVREDVTSHVASSIIPTLINNKSIEVSQGNQIGIAAGDDDNKQKFTGWANGFLAVTTHEDFTSRTKGSSIGFDYNTGEESVAGMALSYARSDMRDKDATNGKIKANTGIVSLYTVQDFEKILFHGMVYGGLNNIKTKFDQNVGNNTETVRGKFKNHTLGINGTLAYKIPLKTSTILMPDIGIKYNFTRDYSYQEEGTFSYNLTVPAKNTHQVMGSVGIKLLKNIVLDNIVWIPEVHANADLNFQRKVSQMSAQLEWGEIVSREDKKPEVCVYNIGTGLTAKVKNMEITTNYDISLSAKKYRKYQGSIKLKLML